MVLEQILRDVSGLQLVSHLGSLGPSCPLIMQPGVWDRIWSPEKVVCLGYFLIVICFFLTF